MHAAKDFHRRPKAVGFPIKILVKDGKKKKKLEK